MPSTRHRARTMITSSVRGPSTLSTRFNSMSLVALGPLMNVSGRTGSSAANACGTVSTTWSARTNGKCCETFNPLGPGRFPYLVKATRCVSISMDSAGSNRHWSIDVLMPPWLPA